MGCDKILQQICDELAEDIHSEVCESIRQHLATCPHCSQQLSSMRTVVQLYRCVKEQEVPSDIHQRLLTLLNVSESIG
jgi:anti-sigma factor (TIGR02949 family)